MPKSLKTPLLILLSAALLTAPFYFGQLGFLAYGAFVPFFFSLANRNSSTAFKYGTLFGCLFFAMLGWWICYVNGVGFVALLAYLSLYFSFFAWISHSFLFYGEEEKPGFNKLAGLRSALFVSAIWVALEYIRGWMIGGLPWALLAYSQWKNITFIQIADITGAYGVSFFVMLVNVLVFQIIRTLLSRKDAKEYSQDLTKRRSALSLFFILTAVTLSIFLYGFLSLRIREHRDRSADNKTVLRVSVLQGNIPQDQKWDARIKEIIFEKYKRLMFMAALETSDLILWPETSFPGYLEDEPMMSSKLRSAIRQSRTNVLVGAPTMGDIESGLRFYNSAVLYNPQGEEMKRYHKTHLVPFGEYIPLETILGFIRRFVAIGHFSSGEEKVIFELAKAAPGYGPKAKFGVLICFEDIFPGLVRDFCRNGANFMVNITNDAWFGRTHAPYQHAQASIFRAVENRVNVIRSTNTGLSCFISPEGRILSTVEERGREIFVTGEKTYPITVRKERSFYTYFGDIFMLLVLGLLFLATREYNRRQMYSKV